WGRSRSVTGSECRPRPCTRCWCVVGSIGSPMWIVRPESRSAAMSMSDPVIGTCYLHTVIDDHSRVAYVEARNDETKETAAEVLRNAVVWFGERGVTVNKVLSDNGSCYRSNLWREACADLGITPTRTRPYRPQ